MARVTKSELYGALERYKNAWECVDVPMDTLRMQKGSSTMGVAYRIHFRNGSAAPGTSDGYLGMTRSEAWETLLTISRTIEDLNYIRMIESERS
jgi:hypothetical protein